MKKYTFIIAAFSFTTIKAQHSLNSCSQQTSLHQTQFEYTIGDMVLVSTNSTHTHVHTQGYLQPIQKKSYIKTSHSEKNESILVYPNPTQNNIHVRINHAGFIRYTLSDCAGKTICTSDLNLVSEFIVPLESYQIGIYHLSVIDQHHQTFSINIQKK